MRMDRDEFKKRFQTFKPTAMLVFVCILLFIITAIIRGFLNGNIKSITEQNAVFENEIIAAKKLTVTDVVFTNIDNVKYDTDRSDEDDKNVFKLFKPILSYTNADDYNAALVKFRDTVSCSSLNEVFDIITYKEADYKSEDEFAGQSRDRYSSLPSSFTSTVVGVHDDRYDYIAVMKASVTHPDHGKYDATDAVTVLITYSTDENGIIYDSFDAMKCS